MKKIRIPTSEQVRYARTLLEKGMGNRGQNDGSYYERLFGTIAQIIVCDLFEQPRPTDLTKADSGHDLIIKGKKWDVKCRSIEVPNRPHFWNSILNEQIKYSTDGYIFVVYNTEVGSYEIVGYIEKEEFLKTGTFHNAGDRINLKMSAYEIQDQDLYPIKDLE